MNTQLFGEDQKVYLALPEGSDDWQVVDVAPAAIDEGMLTRQAQSRDVKDSWAWYSTFVLVRLKHMTGERSANSKRPKSVSQVELKLKNETAV